MDKDRIYQVRVRVRWHDADIEPYDCWTTYLVRASSAQEARQIVAERWKPHSFSAMHIRRGPKDHETLVCVGEECGG